MANTPTTTMRLDPELKDQAMRVLEPLGLNMTGAVPSSSKPWYVKTDCRST